MTPLMVAAEQGRAEIVALLLQSGADPNAADRLGLTPLMLSAARDPFMGPFFPGAVQALVRAGADLNAQDRRGRTALMHAYRHDTLRIRFLQEVQHAERLDRDVYRICSDIIDQGYGSMDKLLKALREDRQVTFWWD